jgi:multidrug resistance efflux pump
VKGLGDPWGYGEPSLKRIHRRIFRLNDKISKLEAEIANAEAELEFHRSIDDDAQRDAAIGNYIDREEAKSTSADVRRFEKTIDQLRSKHADLVTKRDHLIATLG